jgi:hypothetical protein
MNHTGTSVRPVHFAVAIFTSFCSVSPVLFCVFAELLDAAAGRILEREETEYRL